MHQFFAAAAAANMHAVASTASSSPSIGDFAALSANGNYPHPFSGFPTAFQQHPSVSTPSRHQQQATQDLMQQQAGHMYAPVSAAAAGKSNVTCGNSNEAVSPAALMPANMVQFYGSQAYNPPASHQQQQQNSRQATLAAAMAMAVAMTNGSQGPPMNPQMDGAPGDPEGSMRNGGTGTEWWGAAGPTQPQQQVGPAN